jgi:hypothetical protein
MDHFFLNAVVADSVEDSTSGVQSQSNNSVSNKQNREMTVTDAVRNILYVSVTLNMLVGHARHPTQAEPDYDSPARQLVHS